MTDTFKNTEMPQCDKTAVSTSFPLISMTDFALSKDKCDEEIESVYDFHESIIKYAKFLQLPLSLGMFVPCDEACNFLKHPLKENFVSERWDYQSSLNQYRQSQSRCFFNNCVYDEEMDATRNSEGLAMFSLRYNRNLIIEDLVKYNLELSVFAISQLNINVL